MEKLGWGILNYKYRIVKLTNGLGEIHYSAECQREKTFLEKVLLRSPIWNVIDLIYFKEAKVLTSKDSFDYAKENIETHKSRNLIKREIIKV